MSATISPARLKLPVWSIVKASFIAPFASKNVLVELGTYFILPIVVVAAATTFLFWPWSMLLNTERATNLSGWPLFAYQYGGWIQILILMLLSALGAVLLHRSVLCSNAWAGMTHLQLTQKASRYFSMSVLLSLWWIAPLVTLSALGFSETSPIAASGEDEELAIPPFFCIFCLTITGLIFGLPMLLMNRLWLAVVPVAIDAERLSFRQSWQRTRSNTLRLSAVFLAATAPGTVGSVAAYAMFASDENGWKGFLTAITYTLLYGWTVLTGAAALSLSYRHLAMQTSGDGNSSPA